MLKKAMATIDNQNNITVEEAQQLIEILKNKCYLSGMSNKKESQELLDISWKLGTIQ